MWDLKVIDTNKALYVAIAEALERDIHAGLLNPGDMLPTHRALAKKVGVTVTTATRAYAEAEKRGLITAVVGKGTFVTADARASDSIFDTDLNRVPIEMGLAKPLHKGEPDLQPVVEKILRQHNLEQLMQYSDPQGLPKHRETGAEWIGRYGVDAHADTVLVTSGALHGLFCVLYSIFDQGDRIAIDYLTYPGAKAAARRLGLRLEGVMMDEEGMIPEELESLCKRHVIKGIYINGRMQAPTNRMMSQKRREAVAGLIRKYSLVLVEDDSYGCLSHEPKQTMSALVPRQSIFIAGISKAFYAGLRIAFMRAPEKMYSKIAQAIVDTLMLASPFCAEIACECIVNGTADRLIRQKKYELRERVAIFRDRLEGYNYEVSTESMAAWFQLPDAWTASELEVSAEKEGLRIYSADKFAVGLIAPPNYIRVSISGPAELQTYSEGLDILRRVLQQPKY